MANYRVEFSDGYYITKNGHGVLDLANPEDGEFANYVVALLQNAENAKRKRRPTKRAPDSLKAGDSSLPDTVKVKNPLPTISG